MGAFRDFFNDIFGKIKDIPDKLDALIDNLPKPLATFIEIQKWFNPLLAPLKALELISDVLRGKKPEEIEWFGGLLSKGVKGGVKLVTDAALENLTPVFEDFMREENIPEKERKQIRAIAGSGEFGLNSVVGFMLGHFLSPILSTSLAPAWEGMGQIAWKTLPVRLAEPNILVRLKYKDLISDTCYIEQLRKQGIGEEVQKLYEEDFLFYPGPHDLVTWQAREVYEPTMVAKYGLENELEGVLKEPFYKAGMNDEQIRNFWVAHWQHPPWTVIRQMLFRTDLTEADMWDWFKTIEIPPYWRDKYIKIAYNPVGRVDLRRLYKESVYDRDQVKAGYIALGNSPEISEHLTAWTEKAYAPDSKEITKSEILKNYRVGEIPLDKATGMLKALDYEEEEVEFLIAYEDYKISLKAKEGEAEVLLTEVVNGTITYESFEKLISGIGFTIKATKKYLDRATKTLRAQIKLPSKEDVSKWFTLKIITEEEFITMMSSLKYRSEDITRYLEELKKK